MTNQQKEIETIRGRHIVIDLSDADCERIYKITGSHGISVEQLLSSFITDLVGGTYTNGSDERMYANEYFKRCWFGLPEDTFLKYLIEDSLEGVNSFCIHYELLKECEDDIAEYDGKELSDDEKQDMQCIQEEMDYQKAEIQEVYNEYVKSVRKPESFEDGTQNVLEWYKNMKDFRDAL